MTNPDLLLLHGAAGSAAQFEPLSLALSDHFRVRCFDFEGHGSAPDRGRPFRTEHFAENVLEYLDSNRIETIAVFGYSMGGYVGMYLARTRPERIGRVMTLGSKFEWSEAVAAREVKLLDPDKILEKVPQFAKALEVRHTANEWKVVLAKTREMMIALGKQSALTPTDYGQIRSAVRITVGDRDTTVGVEEAARVYRALPGGELGVFPNTPHPLEKVSPEMLARSAIEFFVA